MSTNDVTLAVAIIAAFSGIIAAIIGRHNALVGSHNKREIQELRISVDGRLSALINTMEQKGLLTEKIARLEGQSEGIAAEQARVIPQGQPGPPGPPGPQGEPGETGAKGGLFR